MVAVVFDSALGNVRELADFTLDLAFGSDENAFTLTCAEEYAPKEGQYVYIDGTEYGGIVDESTYDAGREPTGLVTCTGRTWHGILAAKRIMPEGDHLRVSGKVGDVLASLVSMMGLGAIFSVELGGANVSYTFERFCDGYGGIRAMLKASGMKPTMRFANGRVALSAAPIVDYANKVDSDLLDFTITSVHRCVNHLVCAGTGELENRAVIHFYADETGNVSHTQTFFGVDEICALYDYSNADEEKLEEEGKKKLKEYQTQGSVEVEAHDDIDVDVGDVISARDNAHGRTVSATVVKKIVQVSRGVATYKYEVGSETSTKTSSSGSAEGSGGGGHAYFAGSGLKLESYTFSAEVDAAALKAVEGKADAAAASASNASAAAGKAEAFARAATGAAAANAKAIAGKQDALTAGANVTIDGATISATDTTYGEASASASGLMSAADKAALDGLATGATVPKKAETAGRLAEARTVTISGAVNGSATWDGSGDLSIVVAGDSAAAGFLAVHPVGTYIETNGYDPSDYGGEWSMVPSIGPYTWLRVK
ncbi:Gp37-like protein [Slackia isoflavoniconvertens]|uniref:Gp37-like protein n=1 Tax=Slackia isoflavoniconvertens TaxID=572010 RepID=UPI003079C36B